MKAVESFRKMPLYKPEMVKSANFNTRQETNSLLPKERKPNFATNYSGIKRFYVKSLAQPDQKKSTEAKGAQKQGFRKNSRGRGKFNRQNYYNHNNFNNQGYGYQNQNWNNQGFGRGQGYNNFNNGRDMRQGQGNYRPPMSQQKMTDLRNNACFNCHKPGHTANNCTLRNSSNPQGNQNGNTNKK